MKEIKLTKNKVVLVDDEDYARLNQYKWCAVFDGYNWYAVRSSPMHKGKQKTILMHREIMNAPKGIQVDHKTCNGLDNRKYNLRYCTNQENNMNKIYPRKDNKLGIKGVCWHKIAKKFLAQIQVGGKVIYLGLFSNSFDADITYRQAEVKYFGEFARESSRLYIKILNPEYQLSLAG